MSLNVEIFAVGISRSPASIRALSIVICYLCFDAVVIIRNAEKRSVKA
jgi:hypothetical protein